jgi:hypothetical protein
MVSNALFDRSKQTKENFFKQKAVETLKEFEKRDAKVASSAATNLSFLYFLVRNLVGFFRASQNFASAIFLTQ